jgi:hypothetical protein
MEQNNMKKESEEKDHNELRPEYDLLKLKGGVRGKYYQKATVDARLNHQGPAIPSMESLEIVYVYHQWEQEQLENILACFEAQIGGERESYHRRSGAIDIVRLLGVVVVFTAGVSIRPVLQKYFEGLFNADGLKELGEEHRKLIGEWFLTLDKDISKVLSAFTSSLNLLYTSFTFQRNEKAITMEIPIGTDFLYIVLNHNGTSLPVLRNLPRGIVSALRYLCENGVPKGSVALQLYYDGTGEWRYVFAPSVKGFGNYIDRFIDLKDGEIRYIESQSEFVRLFRPGLEDEYKFLVSPFRQTKE